MKKMVDHGHSLGLKVGSYLNNCICMEGGDPPMGEHCTGETHYQQDVDFIINTGFDGVRHVFRLTCLVQLVCDMTCNHCLLLCR